MVEITLSILFVIFCFLIATTVIGTILIAWCKYVMFPFWDRLFPSEDY